MPNQPVNQTVYFTEPVPGTQLTISWLEKDDLMILYIYKEEIGGVGCLCSLTMKLDTCLLTDLS